MSDDPAAKPPFEAHPASPCIGICLMDPATRMCRGCRRTIAEIAAWYDSSRDEKRAILERLATRGGAASEARK